VPQVHLTDERDMRDDVARGTFRGDHPPLPRAPRRREAPSTPNRVTPPRHAPSMNTQQLKNHLDDVERHLKRAKRECQAGSELERHLKRALSALDDAQRECR